MQNYISSNVPLVDIVLVIAVLGIAFLVLYKIISFINSRPDVVALFSLVAIVFGCTGLFVTNSIEQSGMLLVSGIIGLFIAAFTHRRGVK